MAHPSPRTSAPSGLCRVACSPARRVVAGLGLLLAALTAFGSAATAASAGGTEPADTPLPIAVVRELQRVRIPAQALSAVVQEAGSGRTLLSLRASVPVNPASLAKLFTTAAALDQLGPAWTWRTPVWLMGPVRDGMLDGSLHLKGSGDPKLVLEQLWLLLRRVQQLGVREIRGDIVLDGSAFAAASGDPGDFDGETLRPYNVRPDALLLNYKSTIFTFVPDAAAGHARVLSEPPLAGTTVDAQVPLAAGACGDWRARLEASFADAARVRFAGSYPAACGERSWPVADARPATYNARLLAGLWREMGGRLGGTVREGPAPQGVPPSFEHRSPPLLDVVRDINKYSSNVMAQQLFLTLALQQEPSQPASEAGARAALRSWVTSRLGDPGDELVVDNGSGLAREGRSSARLLAHLLQQADASPWAAEFASSLPILGADGTLRNARPGSGDAHLKTGSLKDVAGLAGYVRAESGRRYVLVAIVNHAQANAARPALQALVQWTMREAGAR